MPISAPTVSAITTTSAHITTPVPTGLPGPFTYQYEVWVGTGDFVPGPVTVELAASPDGLWTPSSLVFPVTGGFAPPAQTAVYTPASAGTKALAFSNNRGLIDAADLSFAVSAYSVPGTSYVSPTVQQVVRWSGINAAILNDTDNDLTEILGELIVLAEGETALEVTEAKFTASGLTQHQIFVLQLSVAYHASGNFLLCPEVRVLTGTQEPLLVESGSDLNEVSRALHARARSLSTLYAVGGDMSQIANRMAVNSTWLAR